MNSSKYLTSEDLGMLQRVLRDAGYTRELQIEQPRAFNAAAMLLIGLFQKGTRSPEDLAAELERKFGKPRRKPPAFTASPLHRFAIQGLPAELRRTFH